MNLNPIWNNANHICSINGKEMKYKNTQFGYVMMLVFLIVLFLTGGLYLSAPEDAVGLGVLLIFLVSMLILFSSLTVKITREELIWYFGPGLWKYRMKLRDIRSVATIRTHPAEGFGIRWWPGKGTLYNVSGRQAVQVVRKDGKIRRIGTNEPKKLAQVLQEATNLSAEPVWK